MPSALAGAMSGEAEQKYLQMMASIFKWASRLWEGRKGRKKANRAKIVCLVDLFELKSLKMFFLLSLHFLSVYLLQLKPPLSASI